MKTNSNVFLAVALTVIFISAVFTEELLDGEVKESADKRSLKLGYGYGKRHHDGDHHGGKLQENDADEDRYQEMKRLAKLLGSYGYGKKSSDDQHDGHNDDDDDGQLVKRLAKLFTSYGYGKKDKTKRTMKLDFGYGYGKRPQLHQDN